MKHKIKWVGLALGTLALAAVFIVPFARNYARTGQPVEAAAATPSPYVDNMAATGTPGNTMPSGATYGPQDFRNYMYGMMNWMMGPYWGGYQGGTGNAPQGNYPHWGMMGGYSGYPGQTGGTNIPPGVTNPPSQRQQSPGGKAATLDLKIYPDSKLGPDGINHDAYVPADFTLKEGVPVVLTIYNSDNAYHSFTSPSLGVNIQAAPASSNGSPGITRITFTPTLTGDFTWFCNDPCDQQANGWAMSNDGYMLGTIRVQP